MERELLLGMFKDAKLHPEKRYHIEMANDPDLHVNGIIEDVDFLTNNHVILHVKREAEFFVKEYGPKVTYDMDFGRITKCRSTNSSPFKLFCFYYADEDDFEHTLYIEPEKQ